MDTLMDKLTPKKDNTSAFTSIESTAQATGCLPKLTFLSQTDTEHSPFFLGSPADDDKAAARKAKTRRKKNRSPMNAQQNKDKSPKHCRQLVDQWEQRISAQYNTPEFSPEEALSSGKRAHNRKIVETVSPQSASPVQAVAQADGDSSGKRRKTSPCLPESESPTLSDSKVKSTKAASRKTQEVSFAKHAPHNQSIVVAKLNLVINVVLNLVVWNALLFLTMNHSTDEVIPGIPAASSWPQFFWLHLCRAWKKYVASGINQGSPGSADLEPAWQASESCPIAIRL